MFKVFLLSCKTSSSKYLIYLACKTFINLAYSYSVISSLLIFGILLLPSIQSIKLSKLLKSLDSCNSPFFNLTVTVLLTKSNTIGVLACLPGKLALIHLPSCC